MKSREQIKKQLRTPIGYATLVELCKVKHRAPAATKAMMGVILSDDESASYNLHKRGNNYLISTDWNGTVYLRTMSFSDAELTNIDWTELWSI